MAIDEGLLAFAENLRQDVISRAESDEQEQLRTDQFTDIMIEYLSEAGEIDDGTVCFHKAYGLQVNGYSIPEDGDRIDLFISHHTQQVPPETVGKTEIETLFKRLESFLLKCLDEYYVQIEEASPAFDLAQRIWEVRDSVTRVRFFLFTDGISNVAAVPAKETAGFDIHYQVWDLQRLYQCWTSGRKREAIEVDFSQLSADPVTCIKASDDGAPYACYLACMSGETLVALYSAFGPRLLERNVRSFLQARGNVNRGIRQTILDEPEMFLAYNNGLSATAENVEVGRNGSGETLILQARDFQIVNGGQTTGSLYHAYRKDKADVSRVRIPVKITVLHDPEKVETVVPRISECANSQNKVNAADFSANDPFHIQVQELSRTIWAPAKEGMQQQTRWYYERARGQYQDDKARQGTTPARKRAFEQVHPNSQKFTKTDLAKFENTWNQMPYLVSRGAQKNFQEFTIRLKERGKVQVDERYFRCLIAKGIMFRQAEKIIQDCNYGGYRANIVTYTLALLSHKSAQRIDLERIWKEQDIPPGLREAIGCVSRIVHSHVEDAPNQGNVTEWCKKQECWDRLKEKNIELPAKFQKELLPISSSGGNPVDQGVHTPNEDEQEAIAQVRAVPAQVWFTIARWGKETNGIRPFDRGLAFNIGKLLGRGGTPSRKQAIQAKRILQEAADRGFDIQQAAPSGGKPADQTDQGSPGHTGAEDGDGRIVPIDQVDQDDLMAVIRETFAAGGPRTRDEAIGDTCQALGYQRIGDRIRDRLDDAIRTAVRRGILQNENGQLSLLVRQIDEYARDHLVDQLVAGMGTAWWDREEIIRATARWLGFRRTGPIIQQTLKSAIATAIRRGTLESNGDQVRRA